MEFRSSLGAVVFRRFNRKLGGVTLHVLERIETSGPRLSKVQWSCFGDRLLDFKLPKLVFRFLFSPTALICYNL